MHLRLFHGSQNRATEFEIKDDAQSFSDTSPVRLDEEVVDIHFGMARSTSTPDWQCLVGLERIHFDTQQSSNSFLNAGETLCAASPQF